jgi:hypothetical protein
VLGTLTETKFESAIKEDAVGTHAARGEIRLGREFPYSGNMCLGVDCRASLIYSDQIMVGRRRREPDVYICMRTANDPGKYSELREGLKNILVESYEVLEILGTPSAAHVPRTNAK